MGTTFNSFQIQTGEHKTLEQVKSKLLGYFKTKGLVLADEDTASDTYLLALSENGKWLTVSRPEYDTDMQIIKKDRFDFLEAFKTCCIETSVVDSDMLILNLADYKTEQEDSIMIGADTYGMEDKTGKRGLWEPLLKDGVTWDQLQEILCGEYIFVEEILLKIAPLLGIDENFATSNYSNLDSMEQGNPNIMMLYLKSSKPKPKSLNTVFKEVFGEALEPLGFKKIKGRQPYFVRVVEGGEIIHVITIKNEWCGDAGYKAFNILGGVATVYRQKIDLTQSPRDNLNWLLDSFRIHGQTNPWNDDPESEFRKFRKSIMQFEYKNDDTESLLNSIKHSLKITKDIMLPELNKAIDIDSCIKYQDLIGMCIRLYGDENFGNNHPGNFYNEGLLLIKANKRDYFRKKMEVFLAGRDEKDVECAWSGQILFSDNIYNTPELYSKALAELERRKAENNETLRSYGLEL